MSLRNKQPEIRPRRGTTPTNLVGAATAVLLLAMGFFPALASVRRSSKTGTCLTNLMQIGYANTIYASQDPGDMALPVHRMQFSQCVDPSSGCSDPIYVGAYEWGGKSGRGRPDNVLFPGSNDPLNSKYGTKAGFGPNTRPLNSILYPQELPDWGGLRPGPGGLEFVPVQELGALADTMLDLPLNRCPADTGYTGMHCPDFAQRGLTSYDHFGTSYNANLFMTASGGGLQSSNSPYLHRMSDILAPSNTIAYQENNGRFAWAAAPDPCPVLSIPGVPGRVRGWHGKEWTFNAAFMDGHADTIYMRGYRCEPVSSDDIKCGGIITCIIVRGEGWQIDTLPLPTVQTQSFGAGSGLRPSYEDCVSFVQPGRATSPVSDASGTTCQTASDPGCAAR